MQVPALEALCVLTRRLTGADLAMVALGDGQGAWGRPWAVGGLGGGATPVPQQFWDRMVLERAPLLVPDARLVPRYAADPLVRGGPQLRFYAGVPLIGSGGELLGVLCALSRTAGEGTPDLVDSLQTLAFLAVQWLESPAGRRLAPAGPAPEPPPRLIGRETLLERLDQLLGAAPPRPVALARCRLRDYERIAATCGRAPAEACLEEAARRLLEGIPPPAVVAPFGEAELLLLLPDPGQGETLEVLGDRLLQKVSGLHRIDGLPFAMAVAIGIASGQGLSSGALLAESSLALQMASRSAGSAVRCLDARSRGPARARYRFDAQFHSALHDGSLNPAFQPIVDLATGRPQGLEALVRWEHQGEVLLPARFMPQALDAGVTGVVDLLVVDKTLALLPRLAAALPGQPMTISVNLSSRTLKDEALRRRLLTLLEEGAAPPGWTVQVELLEEAFQDTSAAFDHFLQRLNERRVTIAIDDFGTGYSSLGRLIALPIQRVKLDRTFIAQLDGGDPGPRTLLSRMIVMVRDLGLEITAEGVDSTLQRGWLLDHGITSAQGYLFAPPLAALETVGYLRGFAPGLLRP